MEQNEYAKPDRLKFVSKSCGAGSGPAPGRMRAAKAVPAKKRAVADRVYLLIRIGACALLLAGAAVLRLKGDDETLAVIGKAAYGEENESESEDRLGRLRFVELPSIIDVFAPAKAAVLPTEAQSFYCDEEGRLLVLNAAPGASVVSPAAGSVAALGTDEALGDFITVRTEADEEYTLYGVGKPSVERGQPVKQGQKLAEAGGERVSVRVTRGGRPAEPAEVFGLGGAG